jgi:hypothetical protein
VSPDEYRLFSAVLENAVGVVPLEIVAILDCAKCETQVQGAIDGLEQMDR